MPAELIARFDRIGLAESALAAPSAGFGGVEAYPDFTTKVSVLCWHLLNRGGVHRAKRQDQMIRGVASGSIDQETFRAWIAQPCAA